MYEIKTYETIGNSETEIIDTYASWYDILVEDCPSSLLYAWYYAVKQMFGGHGMHVLRSRFTVINGKHVRDSGTTYINGKLVK